MKKILFLLIIVLSTSLLNGCHAIDKKPFTVKEKVHEKNLSFKIENIILSKGFQSIEPNVEIYKKADDLKLLASLGVIESSGVTVDKITKSNNNINIYINRILNDKEVQLAVPQIMIDIQSPLKENFEDLNFNIINQNYEPINLKFNKKQILNNIYSQFKITSNTIPTVTLTKPKDEIIWNVAFQNIYDRENYKSPLINLNVKINALTGEIIESKKDNISNYIDDGHLLDYIPNNHLLYKKQEKNGDDELEALWVYDMEVNEKQKIYTSQGKIQSALFNPKNEHIAILETNNKKSDIYIVPKESKIAYKITTLNVLQPRLIEWQNNNTLYFVNLGENRSTLFAYNIDDTKHKQIFNLDFVPEEFDILEDNYLFVKKTEDTLNNKIILSTAGVDSEEIGTGFNAKFFNENIVIYLKNIEKEDRNILQIYNKENKETKDLNHNISDYFLLSDEDIGFVEKNTCNSDYTLYKYNIAQGYVLPIANINSDKIYYNKSNNIGYMALNPPSEENKNPLIYSVDLNKLVVME